MLLYFLKIDYFFLLFIYSLDKKAKSKERKAKATNNELRKQHLRPAKRAHCAHC